jgi:hypothetical protein
MNREEIRNKVINYFRGHLITQGHQRHDVQMNDLYTMLDSSTHNLLGLRKNEVYTVVRGGTGVHQQRFVVPRVGKKS